MIRLKPDNGHSIAAFIAFTGAERFYQGVGSQKVSYDAAHRAGADAVNNAGFLDIGLSRITEVSVKRPFNFVGTFPPQVEL